MSKKIEVVLQKIPKEEGMRKMDLINKAQELIDVLPSSNVKVALQNKLDQLKE